ncbi:hypothetical protein [Glycomyces salinus]|uniref:hypothetical protein n=1 Tax=Glycomyces salinus TaxID=980294 RepID=UPI0018EE37A0|nr:hypothetical protein [Glycomyces salinus]
MLSVAHGGGVRHPDDPEPVESTKIVASHTLAAIGLVISPFIGGAIPALLALVLARQAEAEIRDSEGFLLGGRKLARIRRLAWIAIGVSAAVVIVVLLVTVVDLARTADQPGLEGDFAGGLGRE